MPQISPDTVRAALQEAWDDWCADTATYPDCFIVSRGPRLAADFGQCPNFTASIAMEINRLHDPGWQPIETAPRDKTRIIVSVPSVHSAYPDIIGVAYFDPEDHAGTWWWGGTQLDHYHNDCIEEGNSGPPTHWMPLPAPPVMAAP